MTTIERAKRFFKRIDWWSGSNSYRPGFQEGHLLEWTAPRLWCQYRVARALIRQELRQAEKLADKTILYDAFRNGRVMGLEDALEILDAVYGREK